MQNFVSGFLRLNSRSRKLSLFVCLAAASLYSSCRALSPTSRIKIDSGESINSTSANKVEGIFFSLTTVPGANSGGACTGTAVSSTTAITAAHCVTDPGDRVDKVTGKVEGKQYCIDNAIYKKVCSTELYAHPLYLSLEKSGGRGTDFAWVVFPAGTFKYIFSMNPGTVQVGDQVVMVGYSEANLTDKSKGSKRFGWNRVSSLLTSDRSDIFTSFGGKFENVAVSPGDSGGPILKNCQVTGVASRMTEDSRKQSIHTNLTHPESVKTLKEATGGAYFCGLTGNDPNMCPPANMYAPKAGVNASSKEFPCIVESLAQNQGQPPSGNTPPNTLPQPQPSTKAFKIFAALTEANDLLIRAEEGLSSASACTGSTAEAAQLCSSRIPATWDGKQFKAHLNLPTSAGGLTFVKIEAKRQRDGATSTQLIKLQRR